MKQRGRHRRRRRGRALRATLAAAALALTGAATMISASQATVADDPGALKPLTSAAETDALRLTEHRVPAAWLDRLSSAMGEPVGVDAVLDSADRTLRDAADCTTGEREALPVSPPPPAPTAGTTPTRSAGAPARSPPPVTPRRTAAGGPTASSCQPGAATTARPRAASPGSPSSTPTTPTPTTPAT